MSPSPMTPSGGRSRARARAVVIAGALAGALAFGAPASADPDAVGAAPRFERYQALLDSHLTVTSGPAEPLETRFHYRNLRQQNTHPILFRRIRRDLFGDVRPSRMPRAQRLAWAINAYNFLVIEIVTENFYDPRKIRPPGYPIAVWWPRERVQQIVVDGVEMFRVPRVEIEGRTYDLDTFERHFVFDDFDRKAGGKPPRTLDPRAHFALVCAAQGCPPLRPRVYTADSLDAQLARATRDALASPRHLRADAHGITASSIFKWYEADFGGREGAFAFLRGHAPSSAREALARHGRITSYIDWDWTLNQTPLPEFKPALEPATGKDS